jgi:hypothetical protein
VELAHSVKASLLGVLGVRGTDAPADAADAAAGAAAPEAGHAATAIGHGGCLRRVLSHLGPERAERVHVHSPNVCVTKSRKVSIKRCSLSTSHEPHALSASTLDRSTLARWKCGGGVEALRGRSWVGGQTIFGGLAMHRYPSAPSL